MRVLVTGSAGKVGRYALERLHADGHEVFGTDLRPPVYGPAGAVGPAYFRADLTDYGQAAGLVQRTRPAVIVHTAAIPEGGHDPAHVVFDTNTLATFHIAEAAARGDVSRLVYISSETVPGFVSAERPWLPHYLPVDEDHPVLPQDAYGLSKALGEQIVAALVRRTDITAVSIRPSLVLAPEEYGPFRDRVLLDLRAGDFNQWSYVDVRDLAGLIELAVSSGSTGHEVVYAAQPDNLVGRPLADLLAERYGADAPDLRPLNRPDAGAITSARAGELFGWVPTASWRDHIG